VRSGDAQVTAERELQSPAESEAIERGHDGLRTPVERTQFTPIFL